MNQSNFETAFNEFSDRMRAAQLPEIAIKTFKQHYLQLCKGHRGIINESDIDPVKPLPDADSLGSQYQDAGTQALNKSVVIKLNGGLGTSMGLDKAKSLIQVRDDLCFLDIIARQAVHHGLPLILMNSFATRDDSLSVLNRYPELKASGLPLDFVQHKVPKVKQDDLLPVEWPASKNLEWCPPGHGDIYTALVTSGLLDALLDEGKQYAFISNSDNLGATLDLNILGYFSLNRIPFLMEVTDRTEQDKKGGHLAQLKNGQLILRETAQAAESDMTCFQDISLHRYFNTNNLWVDLTRLKQLLEDNDYILELSLISNSKTVDPRDSTSQAVFQLETAMGSAISVFEDSGAIRVSRNRFAPVKTTSDLFLLRSDLFELRKDSTIGRVDENKTLPAIELDPEYYKMMSDFDARIGSHVPGLSGCDKLKITGDIIINSGNTVVGNRSLHNKSAIQKITEKDFVINEDMNWDG